MNKKGNVDVIPRKSPRLMEEQERATQTPVKNGKSPDKKRQNRSAKKRKGKMESSSDSQNEPGPEAEIEEESDSDFVQEPLPKKSKNLSKGECSKSKKVQPAVKKAKKVYSHWASYTNMCIFDDLKKRLSDEQFQEFLGTPFGNFNELPFIRVQPQLIRSILLVETENDRDDMFIINMNGTELRFGIREFVAITGLKCGVDIDFVSDPTVPNRLLELYFPGKSKVYKSDLYKAFHTKGFIKDEDILKMALVFFINSFLLGSEPTKTLAKKKYFDLVETGQYTNYPWGDECFQSLLKTCSHKLRKNPLSFTYGGFHLALQIWFYECCNKVDRSVANRVDTHTPRIFNWKTSTESIRFDDFQRTMFRRYGSQYKFSNMVLTEEESNLVDQNFFVESPADQPEGQNTTPTTNGNIPQENYAEMKSELANVRQQLKELQDKVDSLTIDLKAYIDKSIQSVLDEMRSSRNKTDAPSPKMRPTHDDQPSEFVANQTSPTFYINEVHAVNVDILNVPEQANMPLQPENVIHNQTLASGNNEPQEYNLQNEPQEHDHVCLEQPFSSSNIESEQVIKLPYSNENVHMQSFGTCNKEAPGSSVTKPPTLDDYPEITFTQIVALDTILNETTPEIETGTRNPGKYNTSPYVCLPESGNSDRQGLVYFQVKHPFQNHTGFDVDADLVKEFTEWVYKNVSTRKGRKSAYTVANDKMEYEMDFGILRVNKKDWFHTIVHTGRPWEDQQVDVIMHYLRKKAKYSPNISATYTTVDSIFMQWVRNIEKQWRDSNYDMRSISPDHRIGQCIRGFKLCANIPWDRVDNVIIPVNVSESFHWIMVLFRIKHRCLYVYDSLLGGALHTKRVKEVVSKLAVMLPLFLVSTGFFGKRSDICPSVAPAYIDKSQTDPLKIELVANTPQQNPDSNDCGLYACVIAEFISNGIFEIPIFDAKYNRQRYGTILWHYGSQKHSDVAVSESEVTGSVASKFGGPRLSKEHAPDTSVIIIQD